MKLPEFSSLLMRTGVLVRTHGRLVARLLISAFTAYTFAQYFGLAQSFWSVVTALVVVQASVGGTVTAGIDRLVGTVAGAIVGALAGLLLPLGAPDWLALLLALVPLAFMAAARPGYRIAPITAVIVVLAGADFHPFWLGAAYRVMEITLGTVVGVLVSLLVFPAHASRGIRRQCARAMGPLADLLALFLTERGSVRQDRINGLNDKVRAAVATAEKSVQDAKREPGARMRENGRHGLELGVEIRAVRRLHSDVIFVGRATYDWPKEARWLELDKATEALADAFHRVFDGLAQTLGQGGALVRLHEVDTAVGKLIEVLSDPPESARNHLQKLGVLPFTAQTLRRDIADFSDLLSPPEASDDTGGASGTTL